MAHLNTRETYELEERERERERQFSTGTACLNLSVSEFLKICIPSSYIQALFSLKKFCKKILNFPSHRILRRMHEALNIDKNNN